MLAGWQCRSIDEHLSSMYEALGSSPSTVKQNKTKQKDAFFQTILTLLNSSHTTLATELRDTIDCVSKLGESNDSKEMFGSPFILWKK